MDWSVYYFVKRKRTCSQKRYDLNEWINDCNWRIYKLYWDEQIMLLCWVSKFLDLQIKVMVMGVRGQLYLGHSIWQAESNLSFSCLILPWLIRKRYLLLLDWQSFISLLMAYIRIHDLLATFSRITERLLPLDHSASHKIYTACEILWCIF